MKIVRVIDGKRLSPFLSLEPELYGKFVKEYSTDWKTDSGFIYTHYQHAISSAKKCAEDSEGIIEVWHVEWDKAEYRIGLSIDDFKTYDEVEQAFIKWLRSKERPIVRYFPHTAYAYGIRLIECLEVFNDKKT